MPKVTFTPHAEEQIAERKLSRDLVRITIEQPEETVSSGSRFVAQRVFRINDKDYMIRAVFERSGDEIIVVTAYRTSRMSKYRGSE